MKVSRSKAMRNMLARGIKKAKRTKVPNEGGMINLIYETKKNGWHYQVEYIYDLRMFPKPYVAVYGFKPPKNFIARGADLYLMKEV